MTTSGRWHDLAERFCLGSLRGAPAYVARGSMGEIWRLETAGGCWAVKWQFPWAPADPRPRDVPVQLAAAQAGIPLPLPVLTPDGAAVISAGGAHARVYQWAELSDPLVPPVGPPAAAEAGRLLGILHSLAIPAPEPEDPWYAEPPAAERWASLAGRAAAAGTWWAPLLAAASGLIGDLTAIAVPAGQPPLTCHRDFHPGNVLPDRSDGHLIVLDWENAGRLDPRRELGYALFVWSCGAGRTDEATANALLAGYTATAGRAVDPGAGLFATAAAVHLNFLAAMAEQALDDPEHRSFAEEAIASLLDADLADLSRLAGTFGGKDTS